MSRYTLLLLSICFTFLLSTLNGQESQQLTISQGTQVSANHIMLSLNNMGLEDNGDFIQDSSIFLVHADPGIKIPIFQSKSGFYDLGLAVSSGKLSLGSNLNISHQLQLLKGHLDLNGHGVFLGLEGGEIIGEASMRSIIGEGFVEKYAFLDEGMDMNPGSIGLHLWADSKLGLTRIRRIQHLEQRDSLDLVLRQYQIHPSFSPQQPIRVSMDYFSTENPFDMNKELIPLRHGKGKWESLAFDPRDKRIIATLPPDQDSWNIGLSSLEANVEALKEKKAIYSISPNPFKNHISIYWEDDSDKILEVNLYNMEGKKVYTQRLETYQGRFEIRPEIALPEGMYMVQLISESGASFSEQLLHQ
ncbi:MAG: T9SS type A sorting domain-containing protein [Bacteroidota bacterium]